MVLDRANGDGSSSGSNGGSGSGSGVSRTTTAPNNKQTSYGTSFLHEQFRRGDVVSVQRMECRPATLTTSSSSTTSSTSSGSKSSRTTTATTTATTTTTMKKRVKLLPPPVICTPSAAAATAAAAAAAAAARNVNFNVNGFSTGRNDPLGLSPWPWSSWPSSSVNPLSGPLTPPSSPPSPDNPPTASSPPPWLVDRSSSWYDDPPPLAQPQPPPSPLDDFGLPIDTLLMGQEWSLLLGDGKGWHDTMVDQQTHHLQQHQHQHQQDDRNHIDNADTNMYSSHSDKNTNLYNNNNNNIVTTTMEEAMMVRSTAPYFSAVDDDVVAPWPPAQIPLVPLVASSLHARNTSGSTGSSPTLLLPPPVLLSATTTTARLRRCWSSGRDYDGNDANGNDNDDVDHQYCHRHMDSLSHTLMDSLCPSPIHAQPQPQLPLPPPSLVQQPQQPFMGVPANATANTANTHFIPPWTAPLTVPAPIPCQIHYPLASRPFPCPPPQPSDYQYHPQQHYQFHQQPMPYPTTTTTTTTIFTLQNHRRLLELELAGGYLAQPTGHGHPTGDIY